MRTASETPDACFKQTVGLNRQVDTKGFSATAQLVPLKPLPGLSEHVPVSAESTSAVSDSSSCCHYCRLNHWAIAVRIKLQLVCDGKPCKTLRTDKLGVMAYTGQENSAVQLLIELAARIDSWMKARK